MYTYYLTLRRGKRKSKIKFNIGNDGKTSAVLGISGSNAEMVFKKIVSTLGRYGAVTPVEIGEKVQIYAIREDVGPVVGAYILMVRRSRNLSYWLEFFDELIGGNAAVFGHIFSSFLEAAIDASRLQMRENEKRGKVTIPTSIADAFSASMKEFVRRIG